MSIYDVLQRAESRRSQSINNPDLGDGVPSHTAALGDDVAALAAMVKRLEYRIEGELGGLRQDVLEQFASIEVSVAAMEDRLDEEGGTSTSQSNSESAEPVSAADEELRERFATLTERLVALEGQVHDVDGTIVDTNSSQERLNSTLDQLSGTLRSLESRVNEELPGLRAEFDELIEKRVQSAVSQMIGREQTTRERLEARIDALRHDLDAGQRRHAIALGAALLLGLIAFAY